MRSLLVLTAGRLVLDMAVDEARQHFRIVPSAEAGGAPAVGAFAGPEGAMLTLVAGGSSGRPASIEEIVLGHLAMGRREALAA